ncbi:MAG TPA: TRAP transporter fused permease subunit [Alphaproteobacteria bacterium]|nr:TRAP transporter fused permease subunit [Alphaproteobacteria bacterium]
MADNVEVGAPPPVSPVVVRLRPILAALLTVGSLAWSGDVYRSIGLALFIEQFLTAMLGLALALVFLHYPVRRGTERAHLPWYDRLAVVTALAVGTYASILFPDISERMNRAPLDAIIVSAVFIILSIEGLRRTAGYSLLVIVLIFVIFALIGHLVPGELQTREVKPLDLIIYLGLDSNALLGLPIVVGTTIVLTFIFFGQLLVKSGGSHFFNDISLVLMGRYRGGSAKIAITASSLFGSISGVAVSNIVATGVVTIPLMKRAGFSPRLAASIEAVASTGGQLMPPVMGAVAFLMADFLEMPYREIVIAALVPSLLYYVALFIQADLEAARNGIARVEEDQIPELLDVLRFGWLFILPFAGLIYALFWLNWSAETSALLASGIVLVVGLLFGYKGKRMSLIDIWDALIGTGLSILDILMIVAGAGFIIGVLGITGLGFAFTFLIVEFGGGNLFLLLLVSAVLCIILGMGMPTLGVYVLLAVIVAPSLVEVGITPIAAHMFILYFGMMSLITPPVAVAAFFAASIAQAPAMATGWTSMRFGWTAYVVPFLFVFSPSLLLQGDDYVTLAADVVTAVFGVWLVSAAMIGYFINALSFVMRALAVLAGILLLIPQELAIGTVWTDILGGILALILIGSDCLVTQKRKTTISG